MDPKAKIDVESHTLSTTTAKSHYPVYMYDGAIISIMIAAVSLMLFGWVKDKTIVYGIFSFFVLLAFIFAIAYYVMTQMKDAEYYTSRTLENSVANNDYAKSSGCGCGL